MWHVAAVMGNVKVKGKQQAAASHKHSAASSKEETARWRVH